jgi:hypothetical protein
MHLKECKFEYVFNFLKEKERALDGKDDPQSKEQLELLKEVYYSICLHIIIFSF